MATYPAVTPATLANFQPVINDPTDSEAASVLAQVDLQTRQFVYAYLLGKFDQTTEMLKATAVNDASVAGKVKGSTSNAGTAQGLVQGTVSTPDLRDACVSGVKIAAGVVDATKLAALAVETAKIALKNVTKAQIADNTITAAQIEADSITNACLKADAAGTISAVNTDNIRTGAVTTTKLAAGAVTTSVLPAGSAEGQLLITGVSPFSQAIKSISGDITLTKDGVATLVTKQECELVERANNTVAGGASGAATWNVRGVATAWIESWRVPTAAFAVIGAAGKVSLPVGTYTVLCSAPAYKTGRHLTRLVRYNVADAIQETYYGTSEKSDAADASQTRSIVQAKVTVGASTDYLKLEHYTELVEAVDGLGFPSSSGGTYEVYASMLIRKVA